jgi:CPA1 family monovalent cation:H+ antiporter
MTLIQIVALLITLAALFSYVNFRWIKLPTTIGVMLISLLVSLALFGVSRLGFGWCA